MSLECCQFCFSLMEKRCLDAFCNGRNEEALVLLKQVKDPKRVKGEYGMTLLHYAACHDWTKFGETPLDRARHQGHHEIAEFIKKCIDHININSQVNLCPVFVCKYE